ncbi:MAG: copper ion binding protein [Firmicutes bacterium]|uniref:Copper chaperone CopZ n=1 Tax=Kroppenstedtia guangzhouensis TaxID=1274356 RepID=A0ABQ1H4D4_9BACL|nr:copper ion binding protein [Kroppenstedtia guangzhouensis]MDA8353148.1 copper ion binding protein [Bacillota bacterium]GGA57357.1 copper chaperone CopZ [Kroppenstedtia guangzhouensis]
MKQVKLQVTGMSCGHCVDAVEGAMERIGAKGTVDLEAGTVQVAFDESRVTLEQVKEAIEDQGYDVV